MSLTEDDDGRLLWAESFAALATLREIQGEDFNYLTFDADGCYAELGLFVKEQQRLHAEGSLSTERQKKLESIKFPFPGAATANLNATAVDKKRKSSSTKHNKSANTSSNKVKTGKKKAARQRQAVKSSRNEEVEDSRNDSVGRPRKRRGSRKHSLPFTDDDAAVQPLTAVPRVGTKMRRKFKVPVGWFDGWVSAVNPASGVEVEYQYTGGEDSEQISIEEAMVGRVAFELKRMTTRVPRPYPQQSVRKHYMGDGWYTGWIVSQTETSSLVVFEDGEEEEMSDEEVTVCAAAHSLRYGGWEDLSSLLESWEAKPPAVAKRELGKGSLKNDFPGMRGGRVKRISSDVARMGEKQGVSSVCDSSFIPETKKRKNPDQSTCGQLKQAPIDSGAGTVKQVSAAYRPQSAKTKISSPEIGAKIRKRWDKGWFDGTIVNVEREEVGETTLVVYTDGQEEWMSDAERDVAVGAFELHHSEEKVRTPLTGTKVRKRYDQGWYDGSVVSRSRGVEKARVLYEDGDKGFMSDEEAKVSALAYSMYHN